MAGIGAMNKSATALADFKAASLIQKLEDHGKTSFNKMGHGCDKPGSQALRIPLAFKRFFI